MNFKMCMIPIFVQMCIKRYSVFPQHCFFFKSARVISLSGVQLSGFIHHSHVKTAMFDIVFEVFTLYSSLF